MGRLIEAFAQFFDDDGNPLINGWLEFLESKSNNTHKNTYYDENLQIVNANPLQLDGSGRCPSVFGLGDYRIISYTRNIEDEADMGEQIQVFDPVTAAGTSSGGGGGAGLIAWDNISTYNVGDIVVYNTKVYRSLINGNVGLNPATETSSWEEIEFVQVWNANVTYEVDNLAHYEGNLYVSLTSLNTGNQPDESPTYWRPLGTGYYSASVKTNNYEILPTERDNIIILGPATIANAQFDLPVVGAVTNLFRVAVYNASDYELTINALGGLNVWLDGDLVITKGGFAELIYIHDLTAWVVFGNIGPSLGGQNLGTVTTPIVNAFISDSYLSRIQSALLPDSIPLGFGDSYDGTIVHDGANFYVQSVLGNLNILAPVGSGILFGPNNVYSWTFNASSHLVPINTGVYDIGGDTQRIRDIYLTDNGTIHFGEGNDGMLYSDGTDFFIVSTAGNIVIPTLVVENLIIAGATPDLVLGDDVKLYFDTAKTAYAQWDSANSRIDIQGGGGNDVKVGGFLFDGLTITQNLGQLGTLAEPFWKVVTDEIHADFTITFQHRSNQCGLLDYNATNNSWKIQGRNCHLELSNSAGASDIIINPNGGSIRLIPGGLTATETEILSFSVVGGKLLMNCYRAGILYSFQSL